MSEKTEKPTPYKLKKAKEKGQVAKSIELASALLFLGALLILWGSSAFFDRRLKEVFSSVYSSLNDPNLNGSFSRAFSPIIFPMVGILIGICCLAIAVHLFQTGWIWKSKLSRGKRGKPRVVFPFLKVVVVVMIGYLVLKAATPSYQLIFSSSLEKQLYLFKQIFYLLLEVSAALIFLGICDFFYQKWKFHKQMHMSHQELKEEKRETDGDRETKSRMR